jgi:hypothetical protein
MERRRRREKKQNKKNYVQKSYDYHHSSGPITVALGLPRLRALPTDRGGCANRPGGGPRGCGRRRIPRIARSTGKAGPYTPTGGARDMVLQPAFAHLMPSDNE